MSHSQNKHQPTSYTHHHHATIQTHNQTQKRKELKKQAMSVINENENEADKKEDVALRDERKDVVNLQKQLEQLSDSVDYGFLSLTNRKCIEMNWAALAELGLSRPEMLDYMKKLKGYRYVDELQQLKCGSYLRWIPLTDPENISFTHYGILCEIQFTPNILLVCKNFMHRYYSFYMDEAMIFQKMSRQELMLLSILDTLHAQAEQDGVHVDGQKDVNEEDSAKEVRTIHRSLGKDTYDNAESSYVYSNKK